MKKGNTFLIRLFLTFILLFLIVLLDKMEKLDYEKLKEKLSDDINILKVIKEVNGKSEYFNLVEINGIDDVNVSNEVMQKEEIDNGYRCYIDEMEGVLCETSGVVTNINYNGLYSVTILDSNDVKWTYDNLKSFDYQIYSYIKAGEVIGSCDEFYDLTTNYE